jgi:hypothetical protein
VCIWLPLAVRFLTPFVDPQLPFRLSDDNDIHSDAIGP